jgi:hypothetical protein
MIEQLYEIIAIQCEKCGDDGICAHWAMLIETLSESVAAGLESYGDSDLESDSESDPESVSGWFSNFEEPQQYITPMAYAPEYVSTKFYYTTLAVQPTIEDKTITEYYSTTFKTTTTSTTTSTTTTTTEYYPTTTTTTTSTTTTTTTSSTTTTTTTVR